MKILLSWLREFVDVPGTAEEIGARMSVRGFAVEGIESVAGAVPGAPPDAVLDFEITANRPDCMSVVGIAREVATAYGLPLEANPESRVPGPGSRTRTPARVTTPEIAIEIENADLGPRYVGALADVTVGPSPEWMQARLRAAGVRPISNIVDVTNYVMLELGQPMHAFDLARIGGREIRVRTARAGERLRTLDNQVRELTPDMLVIADATQAVAIAGVMGGGDSEVGSGTTTIVLESAYFNPLSVRRTSKKLGLKTEASMRFERGADPRLQAIAMQRACALIEQIGAGRARGPLVDCEPDPIEPRVLRLRREKVTGLLGMTIADEDIRRILSGLGFALADVDAGWDVTVPTRRVDALREVDLIEEIARHIGFDNVPVRFPSVIAAPAPMDPRSTRARQLRSVMCGAGFSEAMTFGFIGEQAASPFAAEGDLVPIANPLSENFAVLRPSTLPGLIDAVAHNRRREQRDVRLFEVGARFSRSGGERRAIGCAWTGMTGDDHWSGGTRAVDFFDIKGAVARIGDALRVEIKTEPIVEPWLTPGRSASVTVNGVRIGALGQLAAAVAERHGLPRGEAVYVAEIDLDAAEDAAATDLRVEPLPKYPSVTRDISIVIDEALPSEAVRETIRRAAPTSLVRTREFDRYQGKGVPDGRVSLSLRLTFRSPERTLTDADVQSAMDAVLAALKSQHDAVQR
jgi:phenylalanyl-tRNA synthetase beta chain